MFFSCSTGVNPESLIGSEERVPLMIVENITTTYTDSTKLKLIFKAPLVEIYDSTEFLPQSKEAPKGIDITFMDFFGKPKNRITSNFAKLYEETSIWEVRDNVVIRNLKDSTIILTDLLYWNQKTEMIYNEVYTQIVSGLDTQEVHNGLVATQDLNEITFNKTSGSFSVNSDE